MRFTALAALFALAGVAPAMALGGPAEVKSWLDSPWDAKAAFLRDHGGTTEHGCEDDDGKSCWSTTAAEVGVWTMTMTQGEGASRAATWCIGKTGHRVRWCKDEVTGLMQTFSSTGDE